MPMANRLYLLDTNIIIYAQRGHAHVRKRMREIGQSNLVVSSLVAAELAYGVEKSAHKDKNKAALKGLLSVFIVAPWDESPLWIYAENFHRLRSSGTRIGELDLLIGCHAPRPLASRSLSRTVPVAAPTCGEIRKAREVGGHQD